jgi:Xaa-Pro aminopeptidase
MRGIRRGVWAALCAVVFPASAAAQYYQTDFPAEEFRARHAKVFEKIGDNAVAVVQGVHQTEGFTLPRQHNTFYYLSGIETPGAYLLLDGRSKKVTIYLPPRNQRLEAAEGRVLSADDVELVKRISGVDEVQSVEAMGATGWPLALGTGAAGGRGGGRGAAAPAIYAEFSPAENLGQSRGELVSAETARVNDPWDGTVSRQRRFVELLRARHARAEVRNLNPMLDELRTIKSEREIAMLRRASQLAGLGVMEAMRSTEPGVTEYQLDAAARYVFLVNDARQDAYRSITASGTENINNMHYFRNTATLKDGDLVLMDYAPDYRYYVSDIGRVWPVSGKYSAMQRELLQFILEYRNAIMSRIKPGVTPQQIRDDAKKAMEPIFAKTKFSKPVYEKAARTLVDTGGGVFSHTVGMAVHDVGRYAGEPLKPGLVFSVDPQLWVREENLYLRYEDTVVVTATGVENFTHFLPSELADMEKLVQEKGIVQKVPPIPESAIPRK